MRDSNPPRRRAIFIRRRIILAMSAVLGLLVTFCSPREREASATISAQEVDSLAGVTQIDVYTPACPMCRVRVDSLFTVNGDDGALSLDPTAQLLELRDGRTILLESQRSDSLLVFDSTGALLKTFGRHGQGPKEFQGAHALASGLADSVLVLSFGRLTAIPSAFNAARVSAISTFYQAFRLVELDGGQLVFNNYQPRLPAFVVTTGEGDTVRTFGARIDPADHSAGIQDMLQFLLSKAGGNRFWAAPTMFRYELGLWSADGRQLRLMRRHAEWYAPWTREDANRRGHVSIASKPLLPSLISIHDYGDGYLWALVSVPDSRWQEAPSDQLARLENGGATSEFERYADTIIEIFSTSSGNLCVSERFPGFISGLLGGQRAYTMRLEADGSYSVRLLQLWIEGLPKGGC